MQEEGTSPLSSPLRGGVTPLLGSTWGPCALNLNLRGQPPLRGAPALSGRGL